MRHKLFFFLFFLTTNHATSWSQQLHSNIIYRLEEITDSFNVADKKVIYKHSFTYDKQGRPLTHTWKYFRNDNLYSTSTMLYNYDSQGRLLSKISDTVKYKYFYDDAGSLARITLDLHINNKWSLYEETFLKRKIDNGGNELLFFTMNKRRYEGPRKNLIDTFCKIEYTVDSSNNIIHSKVNRYSYSDFKNPREYNYLYDNKPNPLQHIFIQRWYEFDLEDGGLTNLAAKKSGDKIMYSRIYEYNESGYPVICIINKREIKYFKYAKIEVPVQKPLEATKTSDEKNSLLLFPNPATTEVTIKADGLGEGIAHIRLYDINGNTKKHFLYQVDNKLEALIPLNGLINGTYILEIISPQNTIRRKLILQ